MSKNVNVTLSVPAELKNKMDSLSEINWSEVMRQTLSEKVRRFALLRKIDDATASSKLDEKDIEAISENIKEGIAKRHGLK